MFLMMFLGLLFAILEFQARLIHAYELDARLSAIWESNSAAIHAIAQKRACRDGSVPLLTNMENDGDLTTYSLECSEALRNATTDQGLDRRDTVTTLCTTTCTQTCYHPADYNPDPKDCGNATAVLSQRNSNWDVTVGGTTVVQWKTCLYTFTNQAHTTLNFCDTAWGSIGNSIAWTCGRWLADPAKGGICSTTDFYVEAIRTPNMPGPSYTIQFSTGPTTNLEDPTAPVSPASVSSQDGGITTTLDGTAVLGEVSLGLSTVAVQTLPGAPTVAPYQGQAIGSTTNVADSSQTTVAQASSHQVNTAAAVGGTIGGVAILALIIAIFLVFRRFKRHEAEQNVTEPAEFTDQAYPRYVPWGIPVHNYTREKGLEPAQPRVSEDTSLAARSPAETSVTGSSFSATRPYRPAFIPNIHPRSTEALIAAAAPPNMSREQIDLLTANFVSLVRGREPRSEYMASETERSELPPYHHL